MIRLPPRVRAACGALSLSLLAACNDSKAGVKPEEQGLKQRDPTRVRVASVEQREMVLRLSTTTNIESEKEVKVFPRTSGLVLQVLAEEGQSVEAGAVLAQLDSRDKESQRDDARVSVREAEDSIQKSALLVREAAARVESARLSFELAQRDLDRNEKAGLLSQSALDSLRLTRDTRASELESAKLASERTQVEGKATATMLEKAKLALEQRELELAYTRITAPFAGVIAERLVKVGDSVGPGAHVFVLTDAENLRAILYRPQRELALFTQGLRRKQEGAQEALAITARAEALPGLEFGGAIQRLSPSIDAASGSFRVTVGIDPVPLGGSERRLLPGMLVRVEVITDRHPDALVVPKRALRREGELDLVFVAREGRAVRVEVEEGYSDEQSVEVLVEEGALRAGERVIVIGNRELEDGGEIEVEGEGAPPAEPPATKAPAPAEAAPTGTGSDPAKG